MALDMLASMEPNDSFTIPKLGPQPVLISRKEVDALYEMFSAVLHVLESLEIDYIVTGGSLLGAIRQRSILFCDDDIDIAIITEDAYEKATTQMQELLGDGYRYQKRPWEGGDRIRCNRMNNVFIDLFVLRRFERMEDLEQLIGIKKNGRPQTKEYINNIMNKLKKSAFSQNETKALFPCWQFNTRKAIEMWPKEVYRDEELFPLQTDLKFGPLSGIKGPRTPVRLLKRAFGNDCFEVYYQSVSHSKQPLSPPVLANRKNEPNTSQPNLPPLVGLGGTWEGGQKTPLEEVHYLPMQPTARAKRRPNTHNKGILFQYLQRQEKIENKILESNHDVPVPEIDNIEERRPKRTVYMDGVFDLFHVGHLEAIKQCAKLGSKVIIGVTGDADAARYKRQPVIKESERTTIVQALKYVDHVVCPCPLVVDCAFMEKHGIDLVVHGFANEADAKRQEVFFEIPIKSGKFQTIPYYEGQSTTGIIDKIRTTPDDHEHCQKQNKPKSTISKPQWFGDTVAAATSNSATIPVDPFSILLRQAIEPHIQKARKRRAQALDAIRRATQGKTYDSILSQFRRSGLSEERAFRFDPAAFPLHSALLQSLNLPSNYDLSRLHEEPGGKDVFLHTLTKQTHSFQGIYDEFVRSVCAPRFASIFPCDEIYYQAFPCVRIVQPEEFSIGPHADIAYGHNPCSVNFYVLLTKLGGTSSIFIESRPGSEDWHPFEGDLGFIKHFAGAICMHWTPTNKTGATRVSIDFRLVAGVHFEALACGGDQEGGQKDVYRGKEGYYSCCKRTDVEGGCSSWETVRRGKPDARMGFPFTVKNWEKFWEKKKQEEKRISSVTVQ